MPTIELTKDHAEVLGEWISAEIARTENVLWIESRIGRIDDDHRQEQQRLALFKDILNSLHEVTDAVS
jgi:hypothetical protein